MSDDYQQNSSASTSRHSQAKSDSKSQVKSGSKSKAESGSQSESKSGPQPKSKVGSKSQVKSGSKSEAKSGSKSREKSESQSEATFTSKSQASPQEQSSSRSQEQSNSQQQARSQAQHGAHSRARSQAQSGLQSQERPQVQSGSQAKSGSQQQVRSQAQHGSHSRERSQAQPGTPSRASRQAQAQPGSQSKAHSQGREPAGAPVVPPLQTSSFRPAHAGSGRGAVGAGSGGTGGGKSIVDQSGRQPNMPAKKNGKKKGGLWRVVFIVALSVFVVAFVALGAIVFTYWQGQNTYASLAEKSFSVPEDIEGETLADLSVDWDALRAINPDIVGWLYIPDTIINYPIVHSGDDSTYLTRDFYGNVGGSWLPTYGALFLSGDNKPDFSDANNIIYGHNLLNGSMFASLAGFADEAQFNSHRRVYLLTPEKNYRLTSLSLVHCMATDPIVQTTFASPEEYTTYVQTQINASVVAPNPPAVPATEVSQSFAFSTCDNQDNSMRFVLFCAVTESVDFGAGDTASMDLTDPEAGIAIGDAAGALE